MTEGIDSFFKQLLEDELFRRGILSKIETSEMRPMLIPPPENVSIIQNISLPVFDETKFEKNKIPSFDSILNLPIGDLGNLNQNIKDLLLDLYSHDKNILKREQEQGLYIGKVVSVSNKLGIISGIINNDNESI